MKRDVALKILPDVFAQDPERIGRFQREAEVLAHLNHPNIAAIYDFQESQGVRFLVLELVDGLPREAFFMIFDSTRATARGQSAVETRGVFHWFEEIKQALPHP